MFLFIFCLWRLFLLHIKFRVDSFFPFSTFKKSFNCLLATIISDKKSVIISIFVPRYRKCLFFYMKVTAFKIFSLSFVFSSLAVMCIGMIFFIFILCGFTEILVSVCECFSWCMWSFGPLFLQIFLSLYYSLFLELNYSLPRLLDIVSWVAQPLFIFIFFNRLF